MLRWEPGGAERGSIAGSSSHSLSTIPGSLLWGKLLERGQEEHMDPRLLAAVLFEGPLLEGAFGMEWPWLCWDVMKVSSWPLLLPVP